MKKKLFIGFLFFLFCLPALRAQLPDEFLYSVAYYHEYIPCERLADPGSGGTSRAPAPIPVSTTTRLRNPWTLPGSISIIPGEIFSAAK